MLRFNFFGGIFYEILFQISIHPMLRFNDFFMENLEKVLKFQYILCYGSTNAHLKKTLIGKRFQYILCYGSTITLKMLDLLRKYFNTSYVTVQPHQDGHLHAHVLHFNTSYVTVQLILKVYVGRLGKYFNTSYVTVQQRLGSSKSKPLKNFNTSYVTVQPKETKPVLLLLEFQYILCYGSTRFCYS